MGLTKANQTSFKKGTTPWNKGKKTPGVGGRPRGIPAWNKGVPRTWKSPGEFKVGVKPWNTGLKTSGHSGHKHTQEWKDFMSKAISGRKYPQMQKENHFRWIADRTKLAKKQERNDYAYHDWRKNVWLRDNFKCKIANQDCKGRLEAHHILPWRDYEELRYEVNNGITLCHFHHPRKRNDEIKLSPFFQDLVKVKVN